MNSGYQRTICLTEAAYALRRANELLSTALQDPVSDVEQTIKSINDGFPALLAAIERITPISDTSIIILE